MKHPKTGIAAITIFTLFFSGQAFAQKSSFEIGIEGGPGMVTLRGNPIIKEVYNAGIGFSSGLSFQYNMKGVLALGMNNRQTKGFFSLRTGISFERKGCFARLPVSDDQGNDLGNAKFRLNYDYLTLPLLLRASFGDKIRCFVNAGPYMGYLLTNEVVVKMQNGKVNRYEPTGDLKKTDFGICMGAGVSFSITQRFIFSSEARNSLGLYNLSPVPVFGGGSIKTNALSVLVGLAYRLN